MTDRERIKLHLGKLVAGIDTDELRALQEALGKAQNGPPDGEADGSIDAREWKEAFDASHALVRAKMLGRWATS